ncbi:MAG: acylphosphatase [Campylobacterota bacterium]|nr:acylphosphatase [Campylobacterota bacterium]
MSSINSYKFIVSGRVQGVYYRKTINENAQKLNFSGYVKNLPNKDVEACISCNSDDLDKFITILKNGSSNSEVTNIEQLTTNELFSGKFEIRYSIKSISRTRIPIK